jgi:hypothetical protein
MEGRHPMGKDDDMKQTDFGTNKQDKDMDPNNTDQMQEDVTEEIDDYS